MSGDLTGLCLYMLIQACNYVIQTDEKWTLWQWIDVAELPNSGQCKIPNMELYNETKLWCRKKYSHKPNAYSKWQDWEKLDKPIT